MDALFTPAVSGLLTCNEKISLSAVFNGSQEIGMEWRSENSVADSWRFVMMQHLGAQFSYRPVVA